jgi:hypothetical protein
MSDEQHPATTSDVAYRLDMIASELQGLPHVVETCREASARIAAMREGLENIAASAPMIRPARFPNTYKGGYDAASCWSSDVATKTLGASPNPATTELSKNLGELKPASASDDLVSNPYKLEVVAWLLETLTGEPASTVKTRRVNEHRLAGSHAEPLVTLTEAVARLSALERQVAGMREGLGEARSEITRAYRAAANGIPFTPENIPVIRKIAQALATQAESGDQP